MPHDGTGAPPTRGNREELTRSLQAGRSSLAFSTSALNATPTPVDLFLGAIETFQNAGD